MSEKRYYDSFDQDFAESKGQDYKLPDDYRWVHDSFWYRLLAALFYPLVVVFAWCCMRIGFGLRIKNRKVLRKVKGGYFLYSNHVQLLGDVVDPFLITFPKHPYIICSAANLGIPVIGKRILPLAGALPLPEDLNGMKRFTSAVKTRIRQKKCVVVYPEGHLWPYYTEIRPFLPAAFHYPVANQAPVVVATTVFVRRRWHKKPRPIVYLDGPFSVDKDLPKKQQMRQLENDVRVAMERRMPLNTQKYITYVAKS